MRSRASSCDVTHINELVETNVEWLKQARWLLDEIGDWAYAASPAEIAPQRVGGHMRHILEFYECYLEGLQSGVIDYDARRRNPAVETNRATAQAMIDALIRRLQTTLIVHEPVLVCTDGSETTSSTARELQALGCHTVHHFALIALNLRVLGFRVDPDFGMAPSTLRYLAGQRRKEAA